MELFLNCLYYVAIALFSGAVLLIVGYVLLFIFTPLKRKEENEAFEATVVADLISMVLLRDAKGKLYSLHRPFVGQVSVGYVIMVKCVHDGRPDLPDENCSSWNVYGISYKEDAKRVRVIRRLNKELALCEKDKKFIFVRCSADEQEKMQKACTMVVSIENNGNDRQVLKNEEVFMLPVEVVAGIPSFQECVRAN